MHDYLTVSEVACLYRVCDNTVYKAIKRGEIPGCRQLRRRGAIRIPRDCAARWGEKWGEDE